MVLSFLQMSHSFSPSTFYPLVKVHFVLIPSHKQLLNLFSPLPLPLSRASSSFLPGLLSSLLSLLYVNTFRAHNTFSNNSQSALSKPQIWLCLSLFNTLQRLSFGFNINFKCFNLTYKTLLFTSLALLFIEL